MAPAAKGDRRDHAVPHSAGKPRHRLRSAQLAANGSQSGRGCQLEEAFVDGLDAGRRGGAGLLKTATITGKTVSEFFTASDVSKWVSSHGS